MRIVKSIALCFLLAVPAQAANWPAHPTLQAVRVTAAPAIDGDLSDAVWQTAPEFTDFTQHDPDDGLPATQPTSIRVVYDDQAIYIGAKMSDSAPPTSQLARRDSFTQSDFLSINIDSQHDRLSGSSFTINPSNVQVDTVLYNDIGEDPSWDGVWQSATRIVPDGWIAELKIPYSQLRFPEQEQHVWGINITRRTLRTNEWVRIVNTRKGETGFVSHFADLTGIAGIHRGRPLELVPYTVARTDIQTRADRSDPFIARHDQRFDGGLDLKYALTSNLTLTGTINPDFGQVEVDPAIVNLGQFETFYPEKRPFFTEGTDIFRFGDTPSPSHFNFVFSPSLFYSRRIGRTPQVTPDADYYSSPSETTILGAAKVTGKLPGGWSLGVLDALTDKEQARYIRGAISGRQRVEPMTNYFVARVTKAVNAGSRVGFLFTSVDRKLTDSLTSLRKSAVTGGVDGYTTFKDGSWIAEGNVLGSRIAGSADAIALAQRSPARYYQRPDAPNLHYDPSRTSLSGWGARAMVARSTGLWRPNFQIQAYSPGFETNDAGFTRRSDIISSSAALQYVNQKLSPHFRQRQITAAAWQNRNFGGDVLDANMLVRGYAQLQNYWSFNGGIFVGSSALSDRETRGGPVVRKAARWDANLNLRSDERKKFSWSAGVDYEKSRDGSHSRALGMSFEARPMANLQLSLDPFVSVSHEATQYVTSFADPTASLTYGRRYVFSNIEQKSFELATRVDWTLSSRLSFQLYMQPFVSAGDYHDYRSLVAARTRDYDPYAGAVGNSDFNFRSVRGSAVARWEFRPGSALYLVWNENRSDVAPLGDFRFSRDLRAIPSAPSHDVFLVKFSYWIPL